MGAICGYLGDLQLGLVDEMLQLLEHRGPADRGTWCGPAGVLGYNHALPAPAGAGTRIGTSADRRVACVFDGCLFNQRELTAELEACGLVLESREPAEVVANWYLRYGTAGLSRLDGCFALGVCADDELVIARDPLGEKPVYYTQAVPGRVMFASEIKAFLADEAFACEPDLAALNRLLTFSFVPGEETMFRGVRQLLPGQYVRVRRGGHCEKVEYWDVRERIGTQPEQDCVVRTRELVFAAVQKRLGGGGPIGAFLSGGLDSSAVVAVLNELGADVTCYSLGFGHGMHNELMYAQLVAQHCGVRHEILHVEPPMFIDLLPHIIYSLDDPLCDCITVPNYLLAREAGREVQVLFNGEGGDPLFGGPKNKFLILNEWYKHLGGAGTPAAYLSSYHKWYDHVEELYTRDFAQKTGGRQALEEFVRPYLERLPHRSFLNQLMYLNTRLKGGQNILVKVDKMIAGQGLEVMSPLFDRDLAEWAFAIPPRLKRRGDVEKYVFKRAVEDLLPHPVVYRKKAGMGVPLNHWFARTALKDFARDVLLSRRALHRGYFRRQCVETLLRGEMPRHSFGQNRSGELLWMLLAVELWHRVYVDRRGLPAWTTPAVTAR